MSVELIREDPPIGRSDRHICADWLAELRHFPGVWHRFPERVRSQIVGDIGRGRVAGTKPGEFEAQGKNSRPVDGYKSQRDCDLYARYVGEVEP